MALDEVTTNAATMLIPVEISPYAFVEHIVRNCTYDEVLDIIIALDEEMMDEVFTKVVYKYFKAQMRIIKEERNAE